MEIKIAEVDLQKPVSASGSRTAGYVGRFTAGKMIGWAVFVPFEGETSRLKAGATLSVEAQFERLDGWGTAKDSGPSTLTPLAAPCDYRVEGTIAIIGEHTAAIVEAAGFAFDVTTEELPKPRPKDGSRVTFTLHGLSLWDEGV
jgi:hypothetical protein